MLLLVLSLWFLFFCFFFFKQKTAYEMRISDWSSDVCSSDLVVERLGRGRIGGHQFVPDRGAVGIGHRSSPVRRRYRGSARSRRRSCACRRRASACRALWGLP